MQLANCFLVLNEFGSTVPKKDITPAEAQFLIQSHQQNAGKMPIVDLVILDEEAKSEDGRPRSMVAEKKRLQGMYKPFSDDAKAVTIEKMFPGASPQLPKLFSEVVDKDGNFVFTNEGTYVAPEQTITIDGKQYTAEEVKELLAAKE